jgi:hypothetical protein
MPLHEWNPAFAGLFHHHQLDWSIEIARTLNRGRLPRGLSALVEQRAGPKEPDILAIESGRRPSRLDADLIGGATTLTQPITQIVRRSSNEIYAGRANRIVIKHHLGRIVAVIEILSPGNKDSRSAMLDFVEKTIDFLRAGIHVLVVDVFPPTHVIHSEFISSSGMKFSRKSSRSHLARTGFSHPIRPVASKRRMSSRSQLATRYQRCPCF